MSTIYKLITVLCSLALLLVLGCNNTSPTTISGWAQTIVRGQAPKTPQMDSLILRRDEDGVYDFFGVPAMLVFNRPTQIHSTPGGAAIPRQTANALEIFYVHDKTGTEYDTTNVWCKISRSRAPGSAIGWVWAGNGGADTGNGYRLVR